MPACGIPANHEKMVQHASSSLPKAERFYQIEPLSAGQSIREKRGPLSALLGELGKPPQQDDRRKVRQPVQQCLAHRGIAGAPARDHDLASG